MAASDVTAALDALAADPTAPTESLKDAYLNDFESFTEGFRAFAENTHDDIVNAVRHVIATFNPPAPEPPAEPDATA